MRADQDDAASALLDGLDLDTLLNALVRGRGYDPALRDPPGRRNWSDTGPTSLSFMQMADFNGDAASDVLIQISGQVRLWTGWPGCEIPPIEPLHARNPDAKRRVVSARTGCAISWSPTRTSAGWESFRRPTSSAAPLCRRATSLR